LPGSLRAEKEGQLALLDAMVFFAIAMLLSSALISQAERLSENGQAIRTGCPDDASNVLEVVMAASIGETFLIDLGTEIRIARDEPVSECLRAELYALASGMDIGAFDGLNEAVARVLDAVSGWGSRAHLVAFPAEGTLEEPILTIPGERISSADAYASSTDLQCPRGVAFKVLLVLEPAPPSELVQV